MQKKKIYIKKIIKGKEKKVKKKKKKKEEKFLKKKEGISQYLFKNLLGKEKGYL